MALREVYTITELAHLAGLSRQIMNRMLVTNHVPVERDGRNARVRFADLEAVLPSVAQSIAEVEPMRAEPRPRCGG